MYRRLLTIALAAVLALLGTGAVYAYVKGADDRARAGTKAVDVLIAQKRIPAGTSLKDVQDGGYIATNQVPTTAVPDGAMSKISGDMATQVANADIQPGQIVLKQSFGSLIPTTSGLVIPDGMLAVSFSVQSPADVVGYVQPKSEIAIFDTYTPPDAANASSSGADSSTTSSANKVTRLLLSRVQVLAVSTSAPTSTDKAEGAGKLLVTIALNQADTERLIHEVETGSLYLALLSQTSKTAPAPGVDSLGKIGSVFAEGGTP
jgi:pilus assembly protein CpaB